MTANPLLAGIRVLDLSKLLPGPFCTQYLAQLGAEVIKIEEPQGGDPTRSMFPELFELINRGKRSVVLDLRDAQGVALLKHLVGQSDVLIESFRPGVMDRLGCGYETLKAINPRLVYAALTGYGYTGPYRDRAGHDLNYLSYAGVLDQTGAASGPPMMSNVQVADLAGGALTCAVAMLAAVIGARASGAGTFVDCGMLDGALALQTVSTSTIRTIGHSQARGEDMLSGALPNYAIYECADGAYVGLGALERKFFVNFCNAVGRPEMAKLPAAPGNAGARLRAELVALFKTRSRDEWEELLADRDCCLSGIYSPDEAMQNPQVRARELWSQSDGKPAFEFPVRFSNAVTHSGVTPKLGADSDNVLARVQSEETPVK